MICLSEKNACSSLCQCKVLKFSKNWVLCPYVHFKFALHISYWLLCSWLMPLATLHFIFPHQSYVCKDGNSKALNSRGIFDLYQIIVEKVLDE